MRARWVCCLFFLLVASQSFGQTYDANQYDRRQTFALFTDYSNDSSRIVMGRVENRKWFETGFQYEYRLADKPSLSWRYTAEFRPLAWESDPVNKVTNYQTSPTQYAQVFLPTVSGTRCTPGTEAYTIPVPDGTIYAGTYVTTCGRRWTYVSGFSPFGTRINFRPHRRLQPTASLTAGVLMSAKQIPVDDAGSFNFTFEIGAGVEYYLRPKRSLRVEWMYHHFSNAGTAAENPGVDNGLVKVTYGFGH